MLVLARLRSQNGRSLSCFAWQARYFGRVSVQVASLFRGRRNTLWCDLSRCRGRPSILCRAEGAVSTNRSGRDVQIHYFFKYRGKAQHFVSNLKSGASFAKVIFCQLYKNLKCLYKKNSHEIVTSQIESMQFEGISHEMLVLVLQTFKVKSHFRVLRGRRKILEASWLKSWRML